MIGHAWTISSFRILLLYEAKDKILRHACVRTRVVRENVDACVRTHVDGFVRTHVDARVRTHVDARVRTHEHACVRTCMHACLHPCVRVHFFITNKKCLAFLSCWQESHEFSQH